MPGGGQPSGRTRREGARIVPSSAAAIDLFQGKFEKNVLIFHPGWESNLGRLDSFTDVRETQRHLKRQGIAIQRPADEKATGPASFVAVDPNGNPILVNQHV